VVIIITGHKWVCCGTPFFRMCGKERTCRAAILDVWQAKELRNGGTFQGRKVAKSRGMWEVPNPGILEKEAASY
jgi:hypothetical protein